jgi:hypothetical protein
MNPHSTIATEKAIIINSRGEKTALWGAVLAGVLAFASLGRPASHIELGFTLGRNIPSFAGTYNHKYAPQFLYGTATGVAGQDLTITSRRAQGLGGELTFFFHPHLGVQLLVDSYSSNLKVTSSLYHVLLHYVALQPPDYVPKIYTFERKDRWPDGSGIYKNFLLGLNALVRIKSRAPVSLDISSGMAYFRMSGEISSLGFTKFWLGGHSVLFSETYEVKMILSPVGRIGADFGAALNISLGRYFVLSLDARLFCALAASPDIKFELIPDVRYTTEIDPVTILSIPVGKLRVSPNFRRLAAGFKIAL